MRFQWARPSFSKRFVAWPRSLSSMAINDLLNVLEVVLDQIKNVNERIEDVFSEVENKFWMSNAMRRENLCN